MKNLLALLFLFIFLIVFVNPFGDFPLNDDWRYAYPVKSWLENGYISMSDDFAPTILLQVIWAYFFSLPFGEFSFTVLRFSTLLLAFIGIIFFYKLVFKITLSEKKAFWGSIIFMLNPLYFNLSFSFMTDVPFISLCLITIYASYQYFETNKNKFLILIIIGSIGSFLIRQPGILFLPVLGVITIFLRRDKFSIVLFLSLIVISIITYLGFDIFLKPIMGIEQAYVPVTQLFYDYFLENPLAFFLEIFKKVIKTIIYLGFFSLPFLPFIFHKIRKHGGLNTKFIFPIIVFNIGLLFFLHSIGKIFPFGGNIMYNFGLGPELLKDVYTLELNNTPRLPIWVMYFLNLVGQIVGCWLIILIIKTYSELNTLQKKVFGFLLLFNIIYLPLMSITSFYDRYLLITFVSTFLFLILFLDIEKLKPQNVIYFIPFVVMSFFSIAGTKDYLETHRTKLQAFEYLQSKEIGMDKIDAGFELNGWYNFQKNYESPEGISFWWVNDDEYVISFGEIEGYHEIKSYSFWSTLSFQNREILILQKNN